jgi:hypothetical protein
VVIYGYTSECLNLVGNANVVIPVSLMHPVNEMKKCTRSAKNIANAQKKQSKGIINEGYRFICGEMYT